MTQDLDQRKVSPTPPVIGVLVACLALAAVSLLLPSTITYDPLTWATWAREIAHLRLDTAGGPAWKPLPVMVDVIFAPFGQVEKWAWLLVARAGGLLSVAMAYRLARRLAGRWAGSVAAAGMLLSSSFLEYLTPLGMSEPLLAGLALLAVERHMDGKYAQAYGLTFASLLLRPEAFPFFLGYSAFMWIRSVRSRPWVVVLTTLLPVLWLLPDFLSTGDWLRSSRRAQVPTQGGPLLTSHPAIAVLDSAFSAVVLPIVVGAAIAMLFAVVCYVKRREEGTTVTLSLLCVGWLIEEAVITQARLGSGDQRYLIVSVAVGCVLAGVGLTRLVTVVESSLMRLPRPIAVRFGIISLLVLASTPFAVQRLDELSANLGEVPYQAHKYGELAVLIDRAGGRDQILACGPIMADTYQMPALAWQLGIHQSQVIIGVRSTGTMFRTRTIRGSPLLPSDLGSSEFHIVATTGQWQALSTCGDYATSDLRRFTMSLGSGRRGRG